MAQETLINFWRYNVAFSVAKRDIPKYSGTSQFARQPQFISSMFHKVRKTTVKGVFDTMDILFFKEVFPALAVRHITATQGTIPFDTPERRQFSSPCPFHMEAGESISASLFKGASSEELDYLAQVSTRNMGQHPESAEISKGLAVAAKLLKQEDVDSVQHIIQNFFDPTKCNILFDGPWLSLENGGEEDALFTRTRIFFSESALFPFSIRIENGPEECTDRKRIYPENQSKIETLLISLSAEEFFTQFILPLYNSIA